MRLTCLSVIVSLPEVCYKNRDLLNTRFSDSDLVRSTNSVPILRCASSMSLFRAVSSSGSIENDESGPDHFCRV